MTLTHVDIVYQIIVFMFAISVHESAHAYVAYKLGDPTAFMLGRVTLNPIKHVELFGTILLPAVLLLLGAPVFGWAKPTPVNSRNFKHLMRDDILVSVAGPISNFSIAIGSVIALVLIGVATAQQHVSDNSVLVPISVLLFQAVIVNVVLGVFNLIPLPPLDGSHVLKHFLPSGARETYQRLGIVSLILFFTVGSRVINALASPIINALLSFLR